MILLLLSLLHITTCTVYTVTPDDHYYPNTTCHHCHNLQHYLLNTTKYFTSNTKLHFLPGIHHLQTDLIIKNVHNISLIGSTVNGTILNAVIQCNSSVGIAMTNITNLTIKNFIIRACQLLYKETHISLLFSYSIKVEHYFSSVITIEDCDSVLVHHIQIHLENPNIKHGVSYNSLKGINVLGNSRFSQISCFNMSFCYDNESDTKVQKKQQNLFIEHYESKQYRDYSSKYAISVSMFQTSYNIAVHLSNTTFQNTNVTYIFIKQINKESTLHIMNCKFQFNDNALLKVCSDSRNCSGSVYITNCQFLHNRSPSLIITKYIDIKIEHCMFYNNSHILQMYGEFKEDTYIIIRNSAFMNVFLTSSLCSSFMELSNVKLFLGGSIDFTNIFCNVSIISLAGYSTITTIDGLLNISNNRAYCLIYFGNSTDQYIIINENTYIHISHNLVCKLFNIKPFHASDNKPFPYPYCFFQYFSNKSLIDKIKQGNFSVNFHYNYESSAEQECHHNIPITKCHWLPQSGFKDIIPLDPNKQYIQYNNNSSIYTLSVNQSTLCVCSDQIHSECHITDLGYLYPGQTLTLFLYHSCEQCNKHYTEVIVKTDYSFPHMKVCTVLNVTEHRQFIYKPCSKISYTLAFPTGDWCELFLKTVFDSDDDKNVFYVRKLRCPPGFGEINKVCQCDPVITNYKMITCNINDQTILLPANCWISATTHNNFYTYHISLHCPFQYCLPHSSHLNFSNPNSQCQFNRSDLLCGHCQRGLSTIFSSSHCKHCSNIYLLLIIPIIAIGFVLVFILFVLNLTVTDGAINTLYVNIISINSSVFFPNINQFSPIYTFISLANLDLGVQTCFYNGMDDYAKMWLQLAFPFYLIFIATLIIIASRHSVTIQRLTARRALPVLATLFLLSYTKILRIVSSVLFFYSTVTHLPSKHATIVWSVDANVPLFGVRFIILFVVCLILFLILVPFNIILLFTRTLSRFRFINKFKPLLDAYQGPYKDRYYYWTGLQLLTRVIFFGLSSLDRDINLIVGAILLAIFSGICGVMQPYKSKVKNYQELILIFNLHALYVISLHSHNLMVINTIIIVVAVHFIFIITYHITTYMFGGVIRNKVQSSVTTFIGWITRLCNNSQHKEYQLLHFTRENIPEFILNAYHEYREPLVGQDY